MLICVNGRAGGKVQARRMEERAEQLRQKLATYRRRLAEGVDGELALDLLLEILVAEAELKEIAEGGRRK